MNSEILKIKATVAGTSIGQAKFLAQQHYNNNGMGSRVVLSAKFVEDGIDVVYDEAEKKKPAPVGKVVETIGPKDGPVKAKAKKTKAKRKK